MQHTAKILARIVRKSFERNTENVFGEYLSGVRRGKGTRSATEML
jgi:hypothetical protein